MPRQGFTTITVSNDIYKRLREALKWENGKADCRKYRSVSHFVEHLIMDYNTPEMKEELRKRKT